jgi:hypothetical protein
MSKEREWIGPTSIQRSWSSRTEPSSKGFWRRSGGQRGGGVQYLDDRLSGDLGDPSYRGQIVVMTYPLIGNYGVNPEDSESDRPYLSGLIVKECCPRPSNWRATKPLGHYLKEHAVVGLEGIDTRALTRHLRDHGAQQGIISTDDEHRNDLVRKGSCRRWSGATWSTKLPVRVLQLEWRHLVVRTRPALPGSHG